MVNVENHGIMKWAPLDARYTVFVLLNFHFIGMFGSHLKVNFSVILIVFLPAIIGSATDAHLIQQFSAYFEQETLSHNLWDAINT